MKKAIVVGTGAGGATAARELQGTYDVTLLEAGRDFQPFATDLALAEKLKKTGLMFDEREIQFLFPAMKIRKTEDQMVLVNGIGLGGTTTVATGNALRVDGCLKELGINLDDEFDELFREIPISTDHQKRWRRTTRRLYDVCDKMGLRPQPLPKMGDNQKCTNCGHCVLGCPYGAKWDSRVFLDDALRKGATLKTGCKVDEVVTNDGTAVGVRFRRGLRREYLPSDLVVLAAGGFGTPAILERSGIKCAKRLFVDPVLCVAAEWKGALQNREISMPFVMDRNGYILAPYFDYLSFFFNKEWKYPSDDTLSIMIKIADSGEGGVSGKKIEKTLSDDDRGKLIDGVERCYDIFEELGVNKQSLFLGTVNAGHPGGMVPLARDDASTFHSSLLPSNLYVADASLFPSSLGKPPMLTIMAMAKRIGKLCALN